MTSGEWIWWNRIDTSDAAPIRQPPRRLPLSKKEEAQKSVQDMNHEPARSHSAITECLVVSSSTCEEIGNRMVESAFALTTGNSMM